MTTRYEARSTVFEFVNCGHKHRSERAAQKCADRQNKGSIEQGGYAHWIVVGLNPPTEEI